MSKRQLVPNPKGGRRTQTVSLITKAPPGAFQSLCPRAGRADGAALQSGAAWSSREGRMMNVV